MASESLTLAAQTRTEHGTRSSRRLRRQNLVPGVVYGHGEPLPIQLEARQLRYVLSHAGAIVELCVDGGRNEPVLVKESQRHPVRGEVVHVDLLRVRMDEAIHTTVPLELQGVDEAPGVKEGGVLEQVIRELNVEALPGNIPDVIAHDVSGMEMNATITLAALTPPPDVRLLDSLEGTVIATITPPTAEPVEEEVEVETERIGDEAVESPEAQAQAEGATGDEAENAG